MRGALRERITSVAPPADRDPRFDRAATAALALGLLVMSFPWLVLGPFESALLGAAGLMAAALLLLPAGVASLLPVREHRRALLVLAFSATAIVGMELSRIFHDELSYHDTRGRSLLNLTVLFVLSYVVVTLLASTSVASDLRRRAIVAASAFVVAGVWLTLAVLSLRAGVNPVSGYVDAFRTGSFRPILNSIRLSHRDLFGFDYVATIRHVEIRGALVAACLGLGFLSIDRDRVGSVRVPFAALLCASALAVLQFSRVNVAVVGCVALALCWWWSRRLGHSARLAVVVAAVVGILAVTQVGPVRDALFDGSNQSSEIRGAAFTEAIDLADESLPIGVTESDVPPGEVVRSPHNAVLDLMLAAGPVGALAGLGWTVVAVELLVRAVRRQHQAVAPASAVAAAGMVGLSAVVLLRLLTGGGGLLDPVSWTAFGALLALDRLHGPDDSTTP